MPSAHPRPDDPPRAPPTSGAPSRFWRHSPLIQHLRPGPTPSRVMELRYPECPVSPSPRPQELSPLLPSLRTAQEPFLAPNYDECLRAGHEHPLRGPLPLGGGTSRLSSARPQSASAATLPVYRACG